MANYEYCQSIMVLTFFHDCFSRMCGFTPGNFVIQACRTFKELESWWYCVTMKMRFASFLRLEQNVLRINSNATMMLWKNRIIVGKKLLKTRYKNYIYLKPSIKKNIYFIRAFRFSIKFSKNIYLKTSIRKIKWFAA